MMNIFIASSRQQLSRANGVAELLKSRGHHVIKWWEPTGFPGGTETLSRLLLLGRTCDSALFIFGADDEVWIAEGTDSVSKARDNVVLEYGIFVANLHPELVLVLTTKNVTLPTDIAGRTFTTDDTLHEHLNALEKAYTDGHHHRLNQNNFHVFSNKRLIIQICQKTLSWSGRYLYSSNSGAVLWRAIEQSDSYGARRGLSKTLNKIHALTRDNPDVKKVGHVVSFGHGAGELDKAVVQQLSATHHVGYVPVDISYPLLHFAADAVDKSSGNVSVPFAIHGDFEDGMSDIKEPINALLHRPRLFLMLGGTLGNIEASEAGFLTSMFSMMRSGDYFLLDTFVKNGSWAPEKDSFRDIPHFQTEVKEFLANGVAKITGMHGSRGNIASKLADYLCISDVDDSAIPNTTVFRFLTKKQPSKPILTVRRFCHDDLLAFLTEQVGFSLLGTHRISTSNAAVDRSLFLLSRK